MSNYRAIATVTAALNELIDAAIAGVLPGAMVSNRRPGLATAGSSTPPTVNVFLFRAEPNPAMRNFADPVRAPDGRLLRRSVAAWDLHYLLTCIGDEEQLEPEVLLGAVLTALNANATLPPGLLAIVDTALGGETDNRRLVVGSELDQQVDRVRLTPIELSLESLTQLWSSFTKEAYALSVAYQAGVVLMSPDSVVELALPVAGGPSASVATFAAPRITSVFASEGPESPIVIGSELVILGKRLRTEHTRVRIGSLEIQPANHAMTVGRIELSLSPKDTTGVPQPRALAPGVHGVVVSHWTDIAAGSNPPDLRRAASSNVVPIVLRPTITGPPIASSNAADDPVIIVTVAPDPDPDWACLLLLNEVGVAAPRVRVLDSWSITASGDLEFDAAEVPAGEWLVRVQINDADSPLIRGTDGVYAEPKVTVEAP